MVGESFLVFWFFFWPLKTKIQNGEMISFCQKFYMMFSSILQNDGPKPKIFWMKWGTKHTHTRRTNIVEAMVYLQDRAEKLVVQVLAHRTHVSTVV